MEKLLLCFGIVMGTCSSLKAWDYICKGDEATFTYSRDERPRLTIGEQNFSITAFEKKSCEKCYTVSGLIDDIIYPNFSISLQCKEASFDTYIKLASPTEPEKNYKITCHFTRWVQLNNKPL